MTRILIWALIAAIGYTVGTVVALRIAHFLDDPERRLARQANVDLERAMGYLRSCARDTGPVRVVPG